MRCLAIMLALVLCACGADEQKPEGLLDRHTFTMLLVEAHIVEARMNHEIMVEHRQQIPVDEYYQEVFDTFNTDREQFRRTFEYYSARPQELKAIYEEVLVELARRKDEPTQAPGA